LREMFEKEGVTASSALLSTVLLSTASTALPAGLAAAVTTAALTGLATGISAGTGTAAVATSWWTAKTAALIVGAVAITGAGVLLLLDRANRPDPAAPGAAEPPPREVERATASDSGSDGQGVGDAGAAITPVRVGNGTEVDAGPREEPPTAEAQRLVDEAYALRGQQRYEDAEPLVNQALGLSPNFPDAHLVLGMVHEGLGRLEEAAASHTRALELRPTYLSAWYERSRIMAQMKRYDDAAADCICGGADAPSTRSFISGATRFSGISF
jgi:hypothetical protein